MGAANKTSRDLQIFENTERFEQMKETDGCLQNGYLTRWHAALAIMIYW